MTPLASLPPAIADAAQMLSQTWPVLPCAPATKRPITPNGFKDASKDGLAVARWWLANPGAMIGVPTGAASNIFVVDIDIKNKFGPAEPPQEILAALQMEYGDFDEAPIVQTPSGGLHVYFEHDPRIRINGSGKTWKPQIDWRGEGGYVCVPPSSNKDGAYRLIKEGVIAPAPPALIAAIIAAQGGPALEVAGGTASLQYQKTLREIADQITANKDWHANTNVLIARWTAAYGIPPDEWVNLAPFLQQPGYSLEQTIKEIHVSAQGAFKKFAPEMAPKAPPEGLKLYGIDELESREPPDWLIGGVIPAGSLAVLYGDSNTFKTFVALDMVLSMAHGVPWMGRPVKPIPTAYVLGEGQGGFAQRVRAWREPHYERECAGFWTLLQSLSFTEKSDLAALLAALKALPAMPLAIVIDTLARNFGAGDPDKTADMGRFVAAMDALRQATGAAIIIIHHAGKDTTKGARNSSVLRASADVEIRADREEGSDTVRLFNSKQKDAEEFSPLSVKMAKVTFEDPRTGEEATSLAARFDAAGPSFAPRKSNKLGALESRLCKAIRDDGPLTVPEAAGRSGADLSNARKVLARLWQEGVLLRDENTPQRYFLPEQDQ